MGSWSIGVLECWVSVQYSITPSLHYSNLSRQKNPRILTASALGRVDHQRAFFECDSGQSSWKNIDILAIENIGAQIDMPTGKLAIDNDRRAGKPQGGLRYVVARISLNPPREFSALIFHAVRTDQHAVAPGFIDCFHDQLIQM